MYSGLELEIERLCTVGERLVSEDEFLMLSKCFEFLLVPDLDREREREKIGERDPRVGECLRSRLNSRSEASVRETFDFLFVRIEGL